MPVEVLLARKGQLRWAVQITADKARARRLRATLAPQDARRREATLRKLDAQAACLPLTDVYVVRAICTACGCVELEHTRFARHTEIEPLLPNEQLPKFCPAIHAFKCPHLGHCEECVWDDASEECQTSDDGV